MERTSTHDLIDRLLQQHDYWRTTSFTEARFEPTRGREVFASVEGKWRRGKEVMIHEAIALPEGAAADSEVAKHYIAYINEKFNIPWLRLVRIEHVVLERGPEPRASGDAPNTALVMCVTLRDGVEPPDVPERVKFLTPAEEAFLAMLHQ